MRTLSLAAAAAALAISACGESLLGLQTFDDAVYAERKIVTRRSSAPRSAR